MINDLGLSFTFCHPIPLPLSLRLSASMYFILSSHFGTLVFQSLFLCPCLSVPLPLFLSPSLCFCICAHAWFAHVYIVNKYLTSYHADGMFAYLCMGYYLIAVVTMPSVRIFHSSKQEKTQHQPLVFIRVCGRNFRYRVAIVFDDVRNW